MRIIYRSFLLFLLSCLAQTALCAETAVERKPQWAEPVDRSVNMYRITPDLYRSAQLATTDIALTKSLGIKTVVSLRKFHSDDNLLRGAGIKIQRCTASSTKARAKKMLCKS